MAERVKKPNCGFLILAFPALRYARRTNNKTCGQPQKRKTPFGIFLFCCLASGKSKLIPPCGVNPRRGTRNKATPKGWLCFWCSTFASQKWSPAESAAGLFSLRRQLQQGLFIVRRSVQHGVQQILQRITDLSPPQPQRHQVAALHRQVLQ